MCLRARNVPWTPEPSAYSTAPSSTSCPTQRKHITPQNLGHPPPGWAPTPDLGEAKVNSILGSLSPPTSRHTSTLNRGHQSAKDHFHGITIPSEFKEKQKVICRNTNSRQLSSNLVPKSALTPHLDSTILFKIHQEILSAILNLLQENCVLF